MRSQNGARARRRGRTSISGSRRNCIRRFLNGSTEKNTTGVLIQRKFPGTNKVVTRFMAMIPSVTGYRLGTDLKAAVTTRFDVLNRWNYWNHWNNWNGHLGFSGSKGSN